LPEDKGAPASETTPTAIPETAPPEVTAPDKGTPDKLADIESRLAEKEKYIGQQSNVIGDLRRQLDYLTGQVQATAERLNQPDDEPSAPPEGTPDEFFNRPYDAVRRVVERELQAERTQRMQEEQARQAQEAQANYYEGRDAAYRGNKRLFDGMEDRVEAAVYGAYRAGALSARSLASTKTWERAAKLILLEQDDQSLYERVKQPKVQPTSPVQTETPNGRPRDFGAVSIEIDEETRRWGRNFRDDDHPHGLSDKEIEEIVKGELREKAPGGRNRASRSYGG